MQKRVVRYTLINGVLYKRSHTLPLLRSVGPKEVEYVLREIHRGICGHYECGRTLAQKAIRQRFYWPTMRHDVMELIKKCDKCQKFAKIPRCPTEEIYLVKSAWFFARWGINILGPFLVATVGKKFLIVACDYFTKWVEAEPVAVIIRHAIRKFIWLNILCRFEIPHTIITDNGTQFQSEQVKQLCSNFSINLQAASVAYP